MVMLPVLLVTLLPTVSLPYGIFQGLNDGGLTKFLGVPFAQAGRFETPSTPKVLYGVQNATEFGPACPQQKLSTLSLQVFTVTIYPSISEDCLSINVFRPIASNSSSKLPVFVAQIHVSRGGFEEGNSRDVDISPVVERSIETGEPVMVVTPNYRVNAFGFLGGQEVTSAGIFALQWVQQHIAAFGGDPDRVVIGGQSAGAISVAFLLLNNRQNSNSLFRGAFMQAGSPLTSHPIAEGQSDYDGLVAANNCTGSTDTLNCLRHVPLDAFWGTVPFMTGDCDDEGTYLPAASTDQMARIGSLYPDDPTQGSPFDTGTANQLTPEYKRIAAFLGDWVFMAPRRFFLEHASRRQDTWSWMFGASHTSATPIWFPASGSDTTAVDALVNFINTLDPNQPAASSTANSSIFWPKWNTPSSAGSTSLLTFSDPDVINITTENFRVEAIEYLNNLVLDEALAE
ncbi:sterol esterase [Mycena maculata]|uniref:Carboxylic ester hydrolase n=1 Tax=Mycena maculata TaxID=230809 RepID=A0AAD7MIP1_9AGAR|nr:sterol esterase [Mycena maculata]